MTMIVSILKTGLLATVVCLFFSSAQAELASDWQQAEESRVRLLVGGLDPQNSRILHAGIEVSMSPGWKTYWRTPGDTGVPPYFDWSNSNNVTGVSVLFPAPQRLKDKAGTSIGYADHVVFPAEIELKDASQPASLHLAMEIGVCKAICIPVQLRLALDVPAGGAAKAAQSTLAAARARVPVDESRRRPSDPSFVAIETAPAGTQPAISIAIRTRGDTSAVDLFAEGPEGLYVPLPRKLASSDKGIAKFVIDLTDGVDPKDLSGKQIRLTVVDAEGQVEKQWRMP